MLNARAIFWFALAGIGAYLLTSKKGLALFGGAIENVRVRAFLYVIRYAEGTLSPNGYKTLYGGALWTGTDEAHPASMGWRGVPLPEAMCHAAGLSSGCVSTAAGAYQFIRPTWSRLVAKLGLPDFSPESQDRAALALIDEVGALSDVQAGNFELAVSKVRKIWASMPGAGYSQPEKTIAVLADVYRSALAMFS